MTKRILVIEDQEDNRAILRDLLGAAGFTVLEAVDGAAGVTMAAAECASARRTDPASAHVANGERSHRLIGNPLKRSPNLTRADAQLGSILHADPGPKLAAD